MNNDVALYLIGIGVIIGAYWTYGLQVTFQEFKKSRTKK